MRKPSRSTQPLGEPDRHERAEERGADGAKVAERVEAHRRWIGDDGDAACRGID